MHDAGGVDALFSEWEHGGDVGFSAHVAEPILVGADGVKSAVRACMMRELGDPEDMKKALEHK